MVKFKFEINVRVTPLFRSVVLCNSIGKCTFYFFQVFVLNVAPTWSAFQRYQILYPVSNHIQVLHLSSVKFSVAAPVADTVPDLMQRRRDGEPELGGVL